EVRDRKNSQMLYSRGFACTYGEWETTGEAKSLNRTFHESLRFPTPQGPVQVILKKRDRLNAFREIWSVIVDPADMFVDSSRPAAPGALIEFLKSGDPADKVDFLMLCDGYTAAERGKFERDARRLLDILFATSPFKEHKADFNVWGLSSLALESGIRPPSTGALPAAERVEPWEPNVTALLDPDNLKWKARVEPGTPIPTPWLKDELEKHSIEYQQRREKIRAERRPETEMEALFRENRGFDIKLFAAEKYRTKVGAFEGAM